MKLCRKKNCQTNSLYHRHYFKYIYAKQYSLMFKGRKNIEPYWASYIWVISNCIPTCIIWIFCKCVTDCFHRTHLDAALWYPSSCAYIKNNFLAFATLPNLYKIAWKTWFEVNVADIDLYSLHIRFKCYLRNNLLTLQINSHFYYVEQEGDWWSAAYTSSKKENKFWWTSFRGMFGQDFRLVFYRVNIVAEI